MEAKKYIAELRKKQSDPLLWPDFLTGLPDHPAVVRKVDEVYDKLGRYSVAYFRIDNVEPYLAKYGTARHVEIIEWVAAILRSTMDHFGGFVGTVGTHEFLAVCRTSSCKEFVSEATKSFKRKGKAFYNEKDLKDGAVLSFSTNGGQQVRLGLMELKYCVVDNNCGVPREKFIPCLKDICS